MKKTIITLSIIMLISSIAFSQDRTRMRPQDRMAISLFSDIWSDLPQDMKTNTINRGLSIDYTQEFPLGTSNFSFAAGLGFASHNLYSNHWYLHDNDRHNFEKIPKELDHTGNKLSLNYLNVPVEFRYRTRNTPRTFRIHAGIKAGLLIDAHTKYTGPLETNGRETKIKEKKLDNIESFLVGFHGRIGYGRVNLNTFISLTDIFEGNDAEQASFMSIGLSFIVF